MTILDSSASASSGVFTVRLRCNLSSSSCEGAFLLCQKGDFCYAGGPAITQGRIGGSDFVVQPGQVADVPIGLTNSGAQLLSQSGTVTGWVLIDLKSYGDCNQCGSSSVYVGPNGPAPPYPNNTWFSLSTGSQTAGSGAQNSAQFSGTAPTVPNGPPTGSGTTQCDQNIYAGQHTTCPFAANVFKAVAAGYKQTGQIPASVTATSPTTGRTYSLNCEIDNVPAVECSTSDGALVTFSVHSVQVY